MGCESTENGVAVIEQVRNMSGRAKVFAVFTVTLIVLAATGILRSDRDINLEPNEAVEVAREYVDFEPVNADARLVRQGFGLQPVWAVSFSIPEDNNPRAFERLTTVEINATTGEVIRISVDGGDG